MTDLCSFRFGRLVSAMFVPVFALMVHCSAAEAQQAFATPEEAASSLAAALKTGNKRAIMKVLGNDAEEIVDSGDEIADAQARERFLAAYEARHVIKAQDNKKATLIIGTDEFPFPVPLVNSRRGWEFDAAAGRLEILYRRIGRNELDAIQTCLAFVDAENEYAEGSRGGGRRLCPAHRQHARKEGRIVLA